MKPQTPIPKTLPKHKYYQPINQNLIPLAQTETLHCQTQKPYNSKSNQAQSFNTTQKPNRNLNGPKAQIPITLTQF